MKTLTIFATTFNPMIYESMPGVISLYLNKKDAEIALEFEKAEYYKSEQREQSKFESWAVLEYDLNGEDATISLLKGIKNVAQKLSDNN